jgi:EAL domain-containing protein (putative c-di-GMP-specific phosphodiesterase class I)
MSDPQASMETLTRIRTMGIGLAIDDFGTGASACAYLKNLPVQHVKIDRSFIADLISSEHSKHIVRAMIGVIHGLGLKAVAEGIETEEQYRWLMDNGCDMGQGYWMSRPLPADQAGRWLAEPHPGLPPVA